MIFDLLFYFTSQSSAIFFKVQDSSKNVTVCMERLLLAL